MSVKIILPKNKNHSDYVPSFGTKIIQNDGTEIHDVYEYRVVGQPGEITRVIIELPLSEISMEE